MGALINRDVLFPAEPRLRSLARALYDSVAKLPILSPHGHTDPRWYALNEPFPDAARLLVIPDHYIFRMLVSQGAALHDLGVARSDGDAVEADGRKIWRRFAEAYHLFRGTPTRLWMDYVLSSLFGIDEPLDVASADSSYDRISDRLATPEYYPRSLFERFNIEALATTEGALDDLSWHRMIRESGWTGRVITAYRPDTVVDPDFADFSSNVDRLGEMTGEDTGTWRGYLAAHRKRRAFFKSFGATSSDHGHPSAQTANLSAAEAAKLFDRIRCGRAEMVDRGVFRGQMLTEMAKMSLDDDLVMQIHPGSWRNHSPSIMARYGRDMGFDIPVQTDYVAALKPLLDAVGLQPGLTIVLFTLDESAYSRELAPLAGVYPALRLGPAWWFYDSPEGMRRFRELTTETAGFYNTVGFNDDTRAFPSIPARHDIARRVDCTFLARLISEHRLREEEAFELATDLAYTLAKKAYRL